MPRKCMWEWRQRSILFNFGNSRRRLVAFTTPPLSPGGNRSRYAFNAGLGGPKNCCGRFREVKIPSSPLNVFRHMKGGGVKYSEVQWSKVKCSEEEKWSEATYSEVKIFSAMYASSLICSYVAVCRFCALCCLTIICFSLLISNYSAYVF